MGKSITLEEFERLTLSVKAERVTHLSDDDLIAYHRKLHSTSLKETVWIPLIEAEMHRRGLIKRS